MRSRKLSRITIGMARATGTGGLGFTAFRMALGHGGTAGTCVVFTASFLMTGLVAALGLVLNYRLGKLTIQAQTASAERSANLRRMRLELQRSVLDKVQEGTKGAEAYQEVTTADALYLSIEQNTAVANTTTPSLLSGMPVLVEDAAESVASVGVRRVVTPGSGIGEGSP
jgi:hypothetical protein